MNLRKDLCSLIILTAFFNLTQDITAQQFDLKDLENFDKPPKSWDIGGGININPLEEGSFKKKNGSGILIGEASKRKKSSNIISKMTHGDISLEFDFLLSHRASAVVWLQGRYGLRLMDNWNSEKQKFSENGALIPPPNIGLVSYLSRMDAGRAPGIWQHVKINFDAPRFDDTGNKIRSARIVSVTQNGVVIQENQFLQAPSQGAPFTGEVTEDPLVFEIYEGEIAFRNLHYTKYPEEQEKVELENLTYNLYEDLFLDEEFIFWGGGEGDSITLPEFESYKVASSGDLEVIHTRMPIGLENQFALVFEGNLRVPKSGDYHFDAVQRGVGAFVVNEEELFRWNSIHGKGKTNSTVFLEKGSHPFTLNYIDYRSPYTGIFVEGMGVRRQPLHLISRTSKQNLSSPIFLYPKNEPLIQRSFIFYEEEKLLRTINVGFPNNINYSLDLSTGSLLRAWKGGFGDVTSMWRGRGENQVLEPLGSVINFTNEQQVLLSKNSNLQSINELKKGNYKLLGYDLDNNSNPIFKYRVDNIQIVDQIIPSKKGDKLNRILTFRNTNETEQTIWYKIATAPNISSIGNNLFSISDKMYYVEVDGGVEPIIIDKGEGQVLLIPVKSDGKTTKLRYTLIW